MANKVSFASYKSNIVNLKEGINENVSSLELQGGELIDCKNYMIAEGGYGGYRSIAGYERINGKVIPSRYLSVVLTVVNCVQNINEGETVSGDTSGSQLMALEDGRVTSGDFGTGDATIEVECIYVMGNIIPPETVSTTNGLIGTSQSNLQIIGGNPTHNLALTYARNLVTEVPGEGNILGLHIYKRMVYAWRKKAGMNFIGLYVEDSDPLGTGWLEVDTSGDPIVYSGDHAFKAQNYNFYSTTDTYSMFWVDGVNQARVFDGTTVTTIDNTGMSDQGLDSPTHLATHNYHLFLAYRGGSLQHSALGEPLVWDGTVGASEIGLGDEVTSLVAAVASNLIIYLEEGIRILSGTSIADWVLEVFSENTGAYSNTPRRLLGTVFSVGDRGVSTLEAVQEFGDFAANSISQRFKETLFENKNEITTCIVNRNLNQYRIFFENRSGIIISFEGREQQGATFFEYPKQVSVAATGEDSEQRQAAVFASNDETGFVYLMDSGTSFDGTVITCRMSTAFYHYKSPRQYKAFKRATIEVNGPNEQAFDVKVDFDYNELGSPRTIWYSPTIYNSSGGAIYGESKWGIMKYGAAAVATNRVPIYLQGVGTNMSYKIISNETYRPQHTIQNIITDFVLIGRRV